jgi:hypothetical protein
MAEQKKEKPHATPQHLPEKAKPAGCVLMPCPKCENTATRFVFQHLCDDKKEKGHLGVVTLEVPAYVDEKEKKHPHKWKCPVCNGKAFDVVAVVCGECTRSTKFPVPQPKEA